MTRTETEFYILPAFNGDSILIKTFDENSEEFIILIDGGIPATYEFTLKKYLLNITKINLLVLTHIDNDHIGGLKKLFNSSLINKIQIDEIWFNQPDFRLYDSKTDKSHISISQGENFKELILEKKPSTIIKEITTANGVLNLGELEFTILSPTLEIKEKLYEIWLEKCSKHDSLFEDNSVPISAVIPSYSMSLKKLNQIDFTPTSSVNSDIFNSSSIAFLLKCPDVSILFLADSRAEIIVDSLLNLGYSETSPLEVDFVKISHHGSLNNTSQELLALIRSDNYLVSTNGGTSDHKHPSRETIARIVNKSNLSNSILKIYFNYSIESIKGRIGDFISDKDFEIGNWSAQHKIKFTNNDT